MMTFMGKTGWLGASILPENRRPGWEKNKKITQKFSSQIGEYEWNNLF